jgi:ATP-binding protein involved in chromosome partitioning
MENIAHKFLVLSGKGGVGKSTVAVSLAVWLSTQGKNVGLLDIDIHGPSIPKLLHLEDSKVVVEAEMMTPVIYSDTLKVISIGFLLPKDCDALIWRGPMKHNIIKQFVTEVRWGKLDYLVVDCPPGTGDEPLSIAQLMGKIDGVVVVTTPQDLAVIDVKKCITFCRQLNLPVLGVIENMSGFVCPHCNTKTDIFKASGGKQMAEDFNVPFLGSIPIDADMVPACDSGRPFIRFNSQSPTAQAIRSAFKPLLQTSKPTLTDKEVRSTMRIAIPLTNGKLSQHFGHCEQFAIIDADATTKDIKSQRFETPPPHEPGVLPQWLAGLSVDLIIAGGMGQRAKGLFTENNIDVVIGSPVDSPEELISGYLEGRLQCGENICDH